MIEQSLKNIDMIVFKPALANNNFIATSGLIDYYKVAQVSAGYLISRHNMVGN